MLKMKLVLEGTEEEIDEAFCHVDFKRKDVRFLWPRTGLPPLFGLARFASMVRHVSDYRYGMARCDSLVTIECQAILQDCPWPR